MLDSIYHMTLKILLRCIFWCENIKIFPYFMQGYNDHHYVFENL